MVALLKDEVVAVIIIVVVDIVMHAIVVSVVAILEFTILGVIPVLFLVVVVAILGLDTVVIAISLAAHRFPALVPIGVLVIDLNVLVVVVVRQSTFATAADGYGRSVENGCKGDCETDDLHVVSGGVDGLIVWNGSIL